MGHLRRPKAPQNRWRKACFLKMTQPPNSRVFRQRSLIGRSRSACKFSLTVPIYDSSQSAKLAEDLDIRPFIPAARTMRLVRNERLRALPIAETLVSPALPVELAYRVCSMAAGAEAWHFSMSRWKSGFSHCDLWFGNTDWPRPA